MDTDIRWKQRFDNFERAWMLLSEGAGKNSYTELEEAGMIQFFEFTYELAWNTLKDYLTENGLVVKFPREAIKQAFKAGLIIDGDVWIDMLDKRNLMAHTYDEQKARIALKLILNDYIPVLEKFYSVFKLIRIQ